MSTTEGQALPPAEPSLRPLRFHWLEAGFLLLSPILAWMVFDINLINQTSYVDPWFYTGYGQTFERLVQVYGWPYYALRFPVIFLNSVCCSGGDPVLGYGLLRYGLVLIAGIPLYLLASRHFGRGAAACGYLFLFCNALFLRVLLWDLTPFVSIPLAVAGIAIWLLAEHHRWLGRFVAGALFAASINAHVFTLTAIGCFLAVDVALALRDAVGRRRLGRDLGAAVAGAVAMVALGTLYYRARVGSFDWSLLFTTNLAAMRAGTDYVVANGRPFQVWIVSATYVFVPVLLLVAAVALWRSLSRSTAELAIVLFLAAYSAFYALYIYVRGGFVVDQFYYFGHLTVAIYFAVPLVVGLLTRATGSVIPVTAAFALGLLLPVLDLRSDLEPKITFYATIINGLPRLYWFWGLSLALVVLLATRRLSVGWAATATGLLAVAMQLATLAHAGHLSVFDYRSTALERGVYLTGVQYARFVGQYDAPNQRVYAWVTNDINLSSVSFTMLGDAIHAPFDLPRMPTIGKREQARLAAPELRYVMLLAGKPEEITAGKAALSQAGIGFRSVETRQLGDAGYSAIAELVEIVRPAS